MDKNKVIFFDIDGTIWDYKNDIPESTVRAFKELKEKGHLRVLCTGRTKSTIRAKQLKDLDYDGMVAGCGTYIEWKGKTLVNKMVDYEVIKALIPEMKKNNIGAFLEGVDKLFIDWDYYTGSPYAEGFRKELKEDCVDISDFNRKSRVNKLSVEYIGIPDKEVVDFFGNDFDTIIHDFSNRSGVEFNVCEVVPKGYSKESGVQYICDLLNMDIKDSYGFGDSANDVGMLKYVGTGIAMGDGMDITKEVADYVTTPMFQDGIWNGLKHFNLI